MAMLITRSTINSSIKSLRHSTKILFVHLFSHRFVNAGKHKQPWREVEGFYARAFVGISRWMSGLYVFSGSASQIHHFYIFFQLQKFNYGTFLSSVQIPRTCSCKAFCNTSAAKRCKHFNLIFSFERTRSFGNNTPWNLGVLKVKVLYCGWEAFDAFESVFAIWV